MRRRSRTDPLRACARILWGSALLGLLALGGPAAGDTGDASEPPTAQPATSIDDPALRVRETVLENAAREPEVVEPEPDPEALAAEAELDALNEAFAPVDAAMKAIDRDDLDDAEALAASLGDTSAVDTTDADPEPSSEA